MPHVLVCFRVAAIGPSDTAVDVAGIKRAVADLSDEFKHRNVALSFHHWSELSPGLGVPQEYVDKNINWASIDFVVGVMGARFGSSVGNAASGTEHECNLILDLHKKRRQPELLFYFKRHIDTASIDPDQIARVQAFRKRLQSEGLTGEYETTYDLREQIKPALRAKIEGKLSIQQVTQRRVGELPPNRNISVEMVVLSELRDNHVVPTILILKNARDEMFVFDSRYMDAQDLVDWVAHSMGFTKSTGTPLRDVLTQANIDNVRNNTGIIQLWLGNILMMDHPEFQMSNVKILLMKTYMKEGKLGFEFKNGQLLIDRPGPQMIKNNKGEWEVTM
jgi:hypothetical protein